MPSARCPRHQVVPQPQGKIDAFEFLNSAVFSQPAPSRMTLVLRSRASPKRLPARPSTNATMGLRWISSKPVSIIPCARRSKGRRPMPGASPGRHFGAVFLLDTTSFRLPRELKDISLLRRRRFERQRQSAHALRVCHRLPGAVGFLPGKAVPTRGLRSKPAEILELANSNPRQRVLRAAGWRAAQQRGAFLLCPLRATTSLWLADSTGAQAPWIWPAPWPMPTTQPGPMEGGLVGKQ